MLPETMKALVFEGRNRLTLRDWPVPRPAAGEVLIRVHTATICGTDLRIVSGRKTRDVRVGHPIGHECAGTVAAVGDSVTTFAAGDRVAVHPVVTCGQCGLCRADRENLCPQRITLGYHTDGAFAEYMLIPARAVAHGNLFRLSPAFAMAHASLFEPAGCCINGQDELMQHAHATARDLLIIGAGPIGLIHLLLARAHPEQVRTVSLVEPLEHRRMSALRLGADQVCDPASFDAVETYDAVILAAGVPEMVNVALRAARKQGAVNLFAGFDTGTVIPADLNAVHYKQLHITGASESRRQDFAQAMSWTSAGRLDLSPLITHRLPLEAYEEAFQTAADATAIKVAFDLQ